MPSRPLFVLILFAAGANAQTQGSRMLNAVEVPAPDGRVTVDGSGLLTGLSGANIKGRPGSTLFVRPAINLRDGTVLASKASDFSSDKGLEIIGSTILLEPSSGGVGINVPAGARGIVVNSTGALTQPTPGLLTFNSLANSVDAPITGSTDPADSTACQCVSNFGSSLSVGPRFKGVEAYGGTFGVVTSGDTRTISDLVGLASGVSQNYAGLSRIYGGNGGATLGSNGTAPMVIGHEVDVALHTASGTPYRLGYNAANTGSAAASSGDTAFSLMSGPASGQWKRAIGLTTVASRITASIQGTRLSVTAVDPASGDRQVGGRPVVGSTIYGPGVAPGTRVTGTGPSNLTTCSTAVPCTYTVSVAQNVPLTSMQAASLNPAMAADGSVFGSETPQTVATVLDLSNFTVTGQIIKAPGVSLGGDGRLTTASVALNAPPASVAAGQVGYGGAVVADTSRCGSLPGAKGCLVVNVGGTQAYVPYFY